MFEHIPYHQTLYVNFSVAIDWEELKSRTLQYWSELYGRVFEDYFQVAEHVAQRLFDDPGVMGDNGFAQIQSGGRFSSRRQARQSGIELDCIRNGVEDPHSKIVTIKSDAEGFLKDLEDIQHDLRERGTVYDAREDVGIDLFKDCE